MKTASVTELKAQLSRYLRMVRRGTEVQVLDRGVPIARLVGVTPSSGADAGRIDRLARAGILRRGSCDLSWLLDDPPIRTAQSADLLLAVVADREDRF